MQLLVVGPIANEGSVIILEGIDEETGESVHFACDHRPARDILDALSSDDFAEDIHVDVEGWQIIRRNQDPSV